MNPVLTVVPKADIDLGESSPASRGAGIQPAVNNVGAIAGLVIVEIYRRKDFYVLFILTALLTVLTGSVSFFNEEKVVRYLKEIGLFLIWISSLVIAITTTARQIPAEKENRTLFPLLAKPVSRNQFVLGKFFGCWLATGIALLVFYVFFTVISASREHAFPFLNYAQAAMLHWFMLGVVVAMTLLGSIVFAAPSSNSTILFVVVTTILLLGRHLNKFALQLDEPLQTVVYAIYFAIPHLELFDVRDLLVHDWESIPWLIWIAALGYAAVYAAIFVATSCVLFRRKSIN